MNLNCLACALLVLLPWISAPALAEQRPVCVIPINGQIERALVYAIRRGMETAERSQAQAVIFDMDTPGGRLDATEEIVALITSTKATTVTFVNPNAISAGAIIAMATDHIYMSPGGRIGDAMPIIMPTLPFGAPQEMPAGLREKAVSPTEALIRSAAQRKGHDVQLAESMVRAEKGYSIGDLVICPTGQITTLTSQDAAQLVGTEQRPLLSDGTVRDLPELLNRLGLAGAPLIYVRIGPAERIARVIDSFPWSGLLLALGLLALYIEFKTPGFGVPGISGILLLMVWFWGHHIAGLSGMGEVLLFICGAGLLAVEIFLIPGFGVVGVVGLVMMASALVMAMVEHTPGGPWYRPPEEHLQNAVLNLSTSLLVLVGLGALVIRYLPRTPLFKRRRPWGHVSLFAISRRHLFTMQAPPVPYLESRI
jgi:membrane-bound serine protease (ClpP class)